MVAPVGRSGRDRWGCRLKAFASGVVDGLRETGLAMVSPELWLVVGLLILLGAV